MNAMAVPPFGPTPLEQLFAEFEYVAFRLEMQREYRVPGEWELFSAAQSGEIVTEYPFPEWLDEVSSLKTQGRSVRRVLASTAPPSAFFEFRVREYRRNIAAGEEIRVVIPDRLPVTGDFWLFDERIAALLFFDSHGHQIDVEITEDPALITDLIEVKEDLEDWGEPISSYWNRYLGSAADISSVLG
jgi:hypothetical protein